MAATAAEVARLRRLVNEPDATTYTDEDLEGYIERYPVMDERGEVPYTWDTSTSPPTQDENEDWIDTYDVWSAAADIWDEKAAVVAVDFDFRADGGQYSRGQVVEQYERRARWCRSRRKPGTITAVMHPEPGNAETAAWIGNLAEPE